MGRPALVDRAGRLRLDLRGRGDRGGRGCRPTDRDGGAGDGLGRPAHLQLRPQGRLHRHGGLPLGGPARSHEAVAVPGLQPVLHRAVPERPARPHHAPRLHRVAESRAVRRRGMPSFAVLFAAFLVGRVHRRPAAVELPPGEEGRRRARSSPASSRPGCSPTAATRTSSSSRRSGGRSTRSARRRPRHPVSASGAACSTGRSSAPRCSRCCSSARRSSPSRSPRRSTPRTPTTSARTSMLVPLPRRRGASRSADRPPERALSRRAGRRTRAGSTPRTSTRR